MNLSQKRLVSGLFKLTHWPICRAYTRYVMKDKPADKIMRFLCSFQFYRVYRFWPNFVNPTLFSEKLWSRMLHERGPIFTLISDKLRVRDYVAHKVGEKYLIPLLWHGENPEEIPFDNLPSKFIIKTNHGCGYNIIVPDKSKLKKNSEMSKLKKWLGENFCQDKFLGTEWGYKNIKPAIMIETFIGEKDIPPLDYKFYCFAGRTEIITVHFNRFDDHKTKAFNRDFEPYKFHSDFKQYAGDIDRPALFDEMVSVAESLAGDFEFMRVDLYYYDNRIYFGELTPYPAGISNFRGLDIGSVDSMLGKKWQLTK
jgi:hypothetical protein